MTAGTSLLDLIGERTSPERAPAVRAFAQAFMRRLSAEGDGEGPLVPEGPWGGAAGPGGRVRGDRRSLRLRLRARRGPDRGPGLQPLDRRARLRDPGLG